MGMLGRLFLIGCGPGAVDLLTLRALRRIEEADFVLYDRLINPEILSFARQDSVRLYVGKQATDGGRQQQRINEQIEQALLKGKTVVRLKSGDPLIFGRTAEEIEVAEACQAEIEIVPGITASLAAAAETFVTVTERSELQSFVVTTGRTAKTDTEPDWARLVSPGTCVAVYMAVARAWKIQAALMAAGVPGYLPAKWVERAGQARRRVVDTRLDRLALAAEHEGVQNPAILLLRYPRSLAMTHLKTQVS